MDRRRRRVELKDLCRYEAPRCISGKEEEVGFLGPLDPENFPLLRV
jgi:hypothetical protein